MQPRLPFQIPETSARHDPSRERIRQAHDPTLSTERRLPPHQCEAPFSHTVNPSAGPAPSTARVNPPVPTSIIPDARRPLPPTPTRGPRTIPEPESHDDVSDYDAATTMANVDRREASRNIDYETISKAFEVLGLGDGVTAKNWTEWRREAQHSVALFPQGTGDVILGRVIPPENIEEEQRVDSPTWVAWSTACAEARLFFIHIAGKKAFHIARHLDAYDMMNGLAERFDKDSATTERAYELANLRSLVPSFQAAEDLEKHCQVLKDVQIALNRSYARTRSQPDNPLLLYASSPAIADDVLLDFYIASLSATLRQA
ncbi:hypothetical protein JCM10212_001964 [Sporobolomyces blumeae]